MEQLLINKPTSMTPSRRGYTGLQIDVFIYLLSQLDQNKTNRNYKLPVGKLNQLAGSPFDIEFWRETIGDMGSRPFTRSSEGENSAYWLFSSISYPKQAGDIKFDFNNSFYPHLFELRDSTSAFQLYIQLRLLNFYAHAIYLYCDAWRSTGKTDQITVSSLKQMLHIVEGGESGYSMPIKVFKQLVLDESIGLINEYTDLLITYQLEKKGRSFNGYTLTFQVKPQELLIESRLVSAHINLTPTASSKALAESLLDPK